MQQRAGLLQQLRAQIAERLGAGWLAADGFGCGSSAAVGVDIEAGYRSVELMKQYVKGTMRPEVLGGIGGFSGAFSL